jgi:hypothetical protein
VNLERENIQNRSIINSREEKIGYKNKVLKEGVYDIHLWLLA